ncbi:hypothetical protein [Streptomyces marianii]|uniref:2-hydroxy-acid oxidase n=1 Tax=Streptomyces marianii TaxID=1817406 RepID=A0A5R9ECY4_9ACTN|nr:hypothetical protein [Streptomyces marianii]TLQ47866.1 hypothetical protein FEF34_37555 [Streptomyces marianii]
MHTSVPPPAVGAPAPLRLAHAHGQAFTPGEAARVPFAEGDREFFSDLVSTAGLPVDDDAFTRGRTAYAAMVSAILPQLTPRDDFDLALLAHATPDATPGWPLSRLERSTARTGLAFAISDQGTTSPFAALRIAVRGIAVQGARRALVLITEQSAVYHRGPIPEELRARHDTGVALVLDASGELGALECDQHSGVAPGDVPARLAALAPPAEGSTGRPVLIAGAGLTRHWAGVPEGYTLHTAPAGMPAAGIWSVLAERLPDLRRTGRPVVLADYDARFGYLGWCRLDVAADGGAGRSGPGRNESP